ncbi:ATP-binding protein [Streptomyces sp. NPDC057445]|uniref:ATP-binding protein n=1 Tax=Streptomyces sp. NPDC057445 TaxID=3346136 RepID=UPI0036C3C576
MSTSASTTSEPGDRLPPAEFDQKPSLGGSRAQPLPGLEDYLRPGGFAACGLDGRLQNACQARRFVSITLNGWALEALVPDMELVVSELVTNAVQHALGEAAAEPTGYPLWLGLCRRPGQVVCTVTDPSPEPPRPRATESSALGGRGLALVGALSESWSWSLTPPRGKAVWATLADPAATVRGPSPLTGR